MTVATGDWMGDEPRIVRHGGTGSYRVSIVVVYHVVVVVEVVASSDESSSLVLRTMMAYPGNGKFIQGGPSALGKRYVDSKFEVAFSCKFIL